MMCKKGSRSQFLLSRSGGVLASVGAWSQVSHLLQEALLRKWTCIFGVTICPGPGPVCLKFIFFL